MTVPTAAERARTVLHRAGAVTLTAPGGVRLESVACQVGPDARLVLRVPAEHALRQTGEGFLASAEAEDRCPLPVLERVRGRVRVSGWVHRHRGTVALDPWTVQVARGDSNVADGDLVSWEDFHRAGVDPLAEEEAAVLEHLVAAHRRELRLLCSLLEPPPLAAEPHVVPVALDRYGLVLRFWSFSVAACGPVARDARLPFRRPLRSAEELGERFADLLRCLRTR